MDSDEPVKVYDAWDSFQAHFLCQLLAGAGISARVSSDAVEVASGPIPFQKATCPIWVVASDAERARALLVEYDNRLNDDDKGKAARAKSFCYHCGDAIQPGQLQCPHCGKQLDWTE